MALDYYSDVERQMDECRQAAIAAAPTRRKRYRLRVDGKIIGRYNSLAYADRMARAHAAKGRDVWLQMWAFYGWSAVTRMK